MKDETEFEFDDDTDENESFIEIQEKNLINIIKDFYHSSPADYEDFLFNIYRSTTILDNRFVSSGDIKKEMGQVEKIQQLIYIQTIIFDSDKISMSIKIALCKILNNYIGSIAFGDYAWRLINE